MICAGVMGQGGTELAAEDGPRFCTSAPVKGAMPKRWEVLPESAQLIACTTDPQQITAALDSTRAPSDQLDKQMPTPAKALQG